VIPGDNQSDNTRGFDLPGPEPVRPSTLYDYEVTHENGHRLGSGSFATPPAPGSPSSRLRVALLSCHQPFDEEGAVRPDATRMLGSLLTLFETGRPDLIFTVGDQMYTDEPKRLSLFDDAHFAAVAPAGRRTILECTRQEVRQLLAMRYRRFWNIPEWQRLHAEFFCCPIWDDHEMVDNWNSGEEHQCPEWANFGEGGRAAYFDYQGSRVIDPGSAIPSSFHYAIEHGPMAAFVMDLRSERRAGANGRLFSRDQEEDLRVFLHTHKDKGVVLIVFTVPIIHLPWLLTHAAARISPVVDDFSDRWSSCQHIRDRDRMLHLLRDHQQAHPEQRVALLSGDIHIGCAHAVRFKGHPHSIFQFVSSGVTHYSTWLVQRISASLVRSNRRVSSAEEDLHASFRLLQGTPGRRSNPCTGLNAGVLEVDFSTKPAPRLRFQLYRLDRERLNLAFESPWV
jgi:alkaline phosphatase D